jgi:very-short-patch-repair endonuclease/prophage antirepressor-like protein
MINELTLLSHLSSEYFIGYEIANLLGYNNHSQVIKKVSKFNQLIFRDYLGVKHKINPKTILINRNGITEILLKIRKRLSIEVLNTLKKFEIDIPNNKSSITEIAGEIKLNVLSYIINGVCFEYFVGYEIASLLGYTKSNIITIVSTNNKISFKEYPGVKNINLDPKTFLINHDGVIEILLKTRKRVSPEVLDTLKKFKIDIKNSKCLIKEDEDTLDEDGLTTLSYISNGLCFEYFIGYEIAALLGYSKPADVIKNNVSKCNQLVFKDYPGVKDVNLDPKAILITHDGAVEILIKTRKRISPDVLYILKKFHIETTNRKCLTKEQQTLSAIGDVFKTEKIEDQYKVGHYYIDLYFPVFKIVVECDENGHADRKPDKERDRMDFINHELDIDDSHWIRFNPDENEFDISKVIAQIYNFIKVKTELKPSSDGLTLTVRKRRCNVCQIEKFASIEFFKKSGDGFKKTCIECNDDVTGREKICIQYNLDCTLIKRYSSVKEASAETKLIPSQIAAACRGVRKTAGGFIWKFEKDVVENETIKPVINKVKRRVAQYNKSGEFIKEYESASEASRQMGGSNESITAACKNNFVSFGFVWRYIENDEIIEKIEEVSDHRKYMKKVEIYKPCEESELVLFKTYISIVESSRDMKVNVSMVRKYLSGVKKDPSGLVWKFKLG